MFATRLVTTSIAMLTLALLVSCGEKEEPKTAAPPTAAAGPAPQAPPPPPVASAPPPTAGAIGSAQFSGDPNLRCDLLEVKRVSGGAVLVRWRVVNTAAKSIHYDFSWNEVYYIDPDQNKKYGFLSDAEDNKILDIFWGHLPAGDQRLNWAKFPAPPATTTKISVNVPKFTPFEDIPIAQ